MYNAGRACCFYAMSFSFLFELLAADALAGFERRYSGARSLATAGTLCAFGEDAWSFYCNPAHSAKINELSIFYVPSVLGLEEVKATGIAYRSSLLGVELGGAAQTFGFDLYRENVFTANLSVPIYDFLFLGANANFDHLSIKSYGSDLTASIDAGAKMFLSDNFALAFCTTNLNSASATLSSDRLPQTFTGGIAFESDELNVGVEYFKELGFPSAIRIAAEYSPARFVTIRAGSASGTNSFNAGLAFRFMSFELEYGAAFHRILGMTHSFGVSLKFLNSDKTEFEDIEEYRKSLRKE